MASQPVAKGWYSWRGDRSVARVLAEKKAVPCCSCSSRPRRGPARAAPNQVASPWPTPPPVLTSNVAMARKPTPAPPSSGCPLQPGHRPGPTGR
ncbi:hypothetical protein ABZX63_15050 [Streptomyces tendae]|uniref:hypothetical protein n=1 Tax=Streptomyces tendae TaxID=1932 RepID=UPI0033B6BBDD